MNFGLLDNIMKDLFGRKNETLKSIMNFSVKYANADENIKDVARKMVDEDLNYIIITYSKKKYYMLSLTDITPEVLRSNKPVKDLSLPKVPIFKESCKISDVYEDIKNCPAFLVKNDTNESIEGILTMDDYGRNVLNV